MDKNIRIVHPISGLTSHRILQKGKYFYPQHRGIFFWSYFSVLQVDLLGFAYDEFVRYNNFTEAEKFIRNSLNENYN